jgi:hypothetical protein
MSQLLFKYSGRLLSLACGCLALASCQTASVPPSPATAARYQSEHWTKVAAKPPTYYPRGVPADAPVGWEDGEWFRICDAADTRYYIPFQVPAGPRRESLVSEVCSLRTDDYRHQIAKEDAAERKDQVKRLVKYSPVLVPLNTVLLAGGLLTGYPTFVTPDDFEQWAHDWKKTYGNR